MSISDDARQYVKDHRKELCEKFASLAAKINVSKLKDTFGGDIQLWLIIQDLKQGVEKTHFNIDNIDSYLKIKYTPQDLEDSL